MARLPRVDLAIAIAWNLVIVVLGGGWGASERA
jgi:hypothetical protein